jgi:hypothetical protein
MVDSLAGEPEAGEDVGLSQVRELFEDLIRWPSTRRRDRREVSSEKPALFA